MFAKGSLGWIATPLALALVTALFSFWFKSLSGAAVSIALFTTAGFIATFFRDPRRGIGADVVSPADGHIASVDVDGNRLSILLSLFNVHVVRTPIAGEVRAMARRGRSHVPAYKNDSAGNERLDVNISSKFGEFTVTLITGFLARRIVPFVVRGDKLSKGERIGIVRFGSRVDVQLPSGCQMIVLEGMKVRAGETSIAEVVDDSA